MRTSPYLSLPLLAIVLLTGCATGDRDSQTGSMIVVECPKCQRRYAPQVDNALDLADGTGMSVKVPCPNCGQWVRLPEWECVEPPGAPPEILKEMASQSVLLPESDASAVTFGPGANTRPKAQE